MDLYKAAKGFSLANSASMVAEQVLQPSHIPELDVGDGAVEIHLPTLNEELYIEDTLLSLHDQRLVRDGTVDVVLVDSESDDDTVRVSEDYVDEVMETPRGKLTARNIAAKRSDANILVYVDAGDLYPSGWLDHLIAPFSDPEVVATYGPKFNRSKIYKTWSVLSNILYYGSALPGNNHAFHRETFIESGMFNESVNQKSMAQMIKEEEINLMRRMKQYGKVVFAKRASMKVSSRTMPVSPERTEEFISQKRDGVRF